MDASRKRLWQVVDVLILLTTMLAGWQVLHMLAGSVAISSPLGTLAYASRMLADPTFWPHLNETAQAVAQGQPTEPRRRRQSGHPDRHSDGAIATSASLRHQNQRLRSSPSGVGAATNTHAGGPPAGAQARRRGSSSPIRARWWPVQVLNPHIPRLKARSAIAPASKR